MIYCRNLSSNLLLGNYYLSIIIPLKPDDVEIKCKTKYFTLVNNTCVVMPLYKNILNTLN